MNKTEDIVGGAKRQGIVIWVDFGKALLLSPRGQSDYQSPNPLQHPKRLTSSNYFRCLFHRNKKGWQNLYSSAEIFYEDFKFLATPTPQILAGRILSLEFLKSKKSKILCLHTTGSWNSVKEKLLVVQRGKGENVSHTHSILCMLNHDV